MTELKEINFQSAIVKTFAGNGRNSVKDGPVGASSFSFPSQLCIIPNTQSIIVSDQLQSGVRICDQNQLDTFKFHTQQQLPVNSIIIPQNNLQIAYFTDQVHAKIRRVNLQNSEVSTLSGSNTGHRDGQIQQAKYNSPTGVASACNGRILIVCDTGNNVIRCIDFENGEVSTLCGIIGHSGQIPVDLTVVFKKLKFNKIVCIIVSKISQGILYVVDQGNHCIIQIDTLQETGKIIFGIPGQSGKIEIDGKQLLNNPKSICELPDGNLLICDSGNNCIRLINLISKNQSLLNSHIKPKGYQSQYLETEIKSCNRYKKGWVDGSLVQAMFNDPSDIKYNGTHIFIADRGNQLIRIIELDDLAKQKFDLEKSIRLGTMIDASQINSSHIVPKIYCKNCQLECKLFNGKYCDRCGSINIFAVKATNFIDQRIDKNSLKTDYLHNIYFKGDQQIDKTSIYNSKNCLTSIKPARDYTREFNITNKDQENQQSFNLQETFISKGNLDPEFSDISQQQYQNNTLKISRQQRISQNVDEDHTNVQQPLYNFKQRTLASNNSQAQTLVDQVERNYERFLELENTKQIIIQNGGKLPIQQSEDLPTDELFVSLIQTEENKDFIFPATYKLDLKQLQQSIYDFNVDENQYMQDLAECPQHDGFDSLNQMKTNGDIASLQEYLQHLKLIEPISLAVFCYEGDVFFPVPLYVNKYDNCTSFVDTDATTVCFSLFSHIQSKEFFVSLNAIQNRDIFKESQMPDVLPFINENCSELIAHYSECKLSELLKLSKQSDMNNYEIIMNYVLEDGSQVQFIILFGCGSAKGVECENLKLMSQLNQIQFVRREQ
ncbi:NHL repeat-containing protein [Spironucleus salmonicida]|uniref:Haloacid dehalogenase-like hydrolase family protein n=1 Tax=Spironucleus salmonicida TaxID=348837 RepID=V6LN65_9EUKA|nr:NHL repeat-containing protein [Spironucleus salmonicida]|eukprot:EST45658.1 Haloacid dehalogenase-like hydrolase family protein [Spironucleus salmonicida]